MPASSSAASSTRWRMRPRAPRRCTTWADGRRVLRLTDFATSNGPDVRVYLVAAPDAADNETVTKAGFVELGKLKGNEGDQNYDIPAGTDLDEVPRGHDLVRTASTSTSPRRRSPRCPEQEMVMSLARALSLSVAVLALAEGVVAQGLWPRARRPPPSSRSRSRTSRRVKC